jgi:hypothetical protein
VVVDAGDWSGIAPNELPKLPFLLDMMQMMGYDAVTPGEREFGYGYQYLLDLLRQRKLNVVLANLSDKASGRPLWKPYVVVKKQGVKVAIAGLIGRTIPMGAAQDSVVIADPLVVAQKLIPEMHKKADVVVLLAHMGRVDAEDLASQVPGIDVLVIAHHPGLVLASRKINQTIEVAGGEQGQDMGVTFVDVEGKTVTPREGKVVVLTPEVGERADIAKLQKDFNDSLEAQSRREAQAEAAKSSANRPGQPHYLGLESCTNCHQAQYAQWKTTPHAKAFATLEALHKESTPECVGCHVTGFQKMGGFQSAATTSTMANVQCESCHGMASEHDMFNHSVAAPSESLCVTCHTAAQDSTWNFAEKLAKVHH